MKLNVLLLLGFNAFAFAMEQTNYYQQDWINHRAQVRRSIAALEERFKNLKAQHLHPDIKINGEFRLLHFAAMLNHAGIARELCEMGAGTGIVTTYKGRKYTSQELAELHGSRKVAQVLKEIEERQLYKNCIWPAGEETS